MSKLTYITPTFAVSSALSPADIEALGAQGVRAIISNRPDGEDEGQLSGREEAVHAWRNGLLFRHVPALKHELLEDHVVEAVADAVRDLEGPIVAHCKSGIRSAIIWAAASARSQPVDCVLAALARAGFDLEFLRDDLVRQADRRRWLGSAEALDCTGGAERIAA